jgi:ribonuclease HII
MKGKQLSLVAESGGAFQFRAFEEEGYTQGFKLIAGIDEVGRGPLAGPVVAAAVALPRGYAHEKIRDSKLLSAKQREKLAPLIRQNAVCWGIGIVEAEEIDQLNIHQASLLAMVKALASLKSRADCALIDGNQSIPAALFRIGKFLSGRSVFQRTIIKGDRSCISIAAASIVAKVARDEIMIELDKRYPEYGFAEHKGYSCAEHFKALNRYGPSPIHRQSFKPVRDASPQQKTHGPLFER